MIMKTNDLPAPAASPDYKVPADINVALLHTIIAVTALRDVMLKENDALAACSTRSFMDLQEEKIDAGRRYETLVNALMARPDDIKGADAKLKDQLQRLQESFGETAKINRERIERMRNATRLLGERIMKGAQAEIERQNQFAYGATGKMQKGTKALIGLDERA